MGLLGEKQRWERERDEIRVQHAKPGERAMRIDGGWLGDTGPPTMNLCGTHYFYLCRWALSFRFQVQL